jgi:hypothetical protein
MRRRVKDFIEIGDYTSLDQLIATLTAIRDNLPDNADAELRLRGDDVFGRRLSITYFRELSAEEEACEARYSAATLPEDNAAIEGLREKLDEVNYEPPKQRIRRVA